MNLGRQPDLEDRGVARTCEVGGPAPRPNHGPSADGHQLVIGAESQIRPREWISALARGMLTAAGASRRPGNDRDLDERASAGGESLGPDFPRILAMRYRIQIVLSVLLWSVGGAGRAWAADRPLRVVTFQADVTPPLGSPLCDGAVKPAGEIVDPLSCRGIVLLVEPRPIVLCAVDWVGIGNGGYDAWRSALAEAAGTTADRVAVHCLHQHDAPGVRLPTPRR